MMAANLNEDNIIEALKKIIHDIRSPIASLKMLYSHSDDLSAKDKNLIGSATQRIGSMVDLLAKCLPKVNEAEHSHCGMDAVTEKKEQIKVPSLIEKILLEKKYEYTKSNIEFVYTLPANANDLLINCEADAFERMFSNLVNNAVAACDHNGKIIITINTSGHRLELTIEDNGCGIPPEVIAKIKNNEIVTHNKKNGQGIGFTQIRGTLNNYRGKLDISSTIGVGTKIKLSFPLVSS